MNLLIVDDSPVTRRLLRAVFEAEHVNVFEAADGVEALALLAHDRIDAVISDILMPRMDGYRLCHEIRDSERLRNTPVIIYSATYTTAQDESLALEMGADRFLRKPASPAALLAIVRECIAQPVLHDPPAAPLAELTLMRNYSERLVAKLEERNLELEEARIELREANALLEWRVQRRTEELAAANDQLDSFASFVAHEMRSPLRAIGTFIAQLEEHLVQGHADESRRVAHLVAHTVHQTELLTEALLRFCQLGARPVRRQPVNLNELVRRILDRLGEAEPARAADVAVQDLPACNADPLLLEHVFQNLLSNAFKFTHTRATPRIEVGVREGDGPPVLYVRDNGIGFDMRFAHLVFEPFQQLHRADGFGGSGLGLSLVRNIINRHGGSIWAESTVDEGTTFYFSLTGGTVASPLAGHAAAQA